jgi:hypothetical protein
MSKRKYNYEEDLYEEDDYYDDEDYYDNYEDYEEEEEEKPKKIQKKIIAITILLKFKIKMIIKI